MMELRKELCNELRASGLPFRRVLAKTAPLKFDVALWRNW